ncbi:MAG: Calx-beta domain-containing protein, partial [Woeseia sp.]
HRPQGLSDPQWRALRKALAYSRVARFKTPAEFVEALGSEEGVESEAPFPRGAGAPLLVEPKSQLAGLQDRRYWPAALAVVALLAVAVALFSMAIMPNDQSMFDRTRALFAPEGGQLESMPTVDGEAVTPPGPLDQPGSRQANPTQDSGERASVADRQPEDSIETAEREREDRTVRTPAAAPPASAGESRQVEREPAPVAVDPVGGQEVTEDVSPRQADDPADAAGQEPPAAGANVGGQTAQGSLESGLPQDTVGFRVSRMYVSEGEAAVRIDVMRLNPSDSSLEVRYFVGGGTATEGEDYFLPDAFRLVFAPRQRMARLLIPLVQDSVLESDETLSLELMTDIENPEADIFPRIEVIIRDNDG